MAKFKRDYDLDKEEVEELLGDFSIVLSEIKKPQEAVVFIRDLLSEQEATMLAKRLKIAELLLEGQAYADIADELKVSTGTIARVNEWLTLSGEGYRLLVARLKNKKGKKKRAEDENGFTTSDLKRRYPMYYWPQILLEGVVKGADRQQRRQIRQTLRSMETKTALYKRLSKLLH